MDWLLAFSCNSLGNVLCNSVLNHISKSMENALGASWVHIFTFPHDFLIRSLWGMPLEFHGPMISHLCLKSISQCGMRISWTNSFKFPHHIFIRNEMENLPGALWANYFAFLYQICINNQWKVLLQLSCKSHQVPLLNPC